jgi:hypothetical protein
MAFDPMSGGHAFDRSTDRCQRCDMTRRHYQDNDNPRCTGEKPESREFLIDDESE